MTSWKSFPAWSVIENSNSQHELTLLDSILELLDKRLSFQLTKWLKLTGLSGLFHRFQLLLGKLDSGLQKDSSSQAKRRNVSTRCNAETIQTTEAIRRQDRRRGWKGAILLQVLSTAVKSFMPRVALFHPRRVSLDWGSMKREQICDRIIKQKFLQRTPDSLPQRQINSLVCFLPTWTEMTMRETSWIIT